MMLELALALSTLGAYGSWSGGGDKTVCVDVVNGRREVAETKKILYKGKTRERSNMI